MKITHLVELSKDSPLGKMLDKFSNDIPTSGISDKIGNAFSNVFKPDTTEKPTDASTKSTDTSPKPITKSTSTGSGNVLADVEAEMDRQGIKDPFVRKAILAKTGQEAGSKYGTTEIPFKGTSNKRIKEKLPQLSSLSDEELTALKQDTEAFFNRAYGYKGNTLGNNEPGDGFKYRGRGLTGLTGKVNYQRADDALGLKGALVKNPDLLLDPEIDRRASVWYYKSAGADKVQFANQDDANKWAIHKAGGNLYAPGTQLGNIALADLNTRTAGIVAGTGVAVLAGPPLLSKAKDVISNIKSNANTAIDTAKKTATRSIAGAALAGIGGSSGGSSSGGYRTSPTPTEEEVTLIINGKRRKFKNKREAKIAMEIARSQGADVRYG